MLRARARKKREITEVFREGNALIMQSQSGLIRLIVQTQNIIRVSYTENQGFDGKQGQGDLQKFPSKSAGNDT